MSIREAVNDDEFLNTKFISTIQKRGAAIIEARKLSSAMSAAKAITDHMNNWFLGTKDGSYGVAKGIIYSFPVTIKDGKVSIVQSLTVDEFSKKQMKVTEDELLDEKKVAFEFLGVN
jgi:malate dehydrogenase